jgi:hypothetical protein
VYVLWLLKTPRRNWVIAACADRVCIRVGVNIPEVIMLEVSEIASMSIKTIEVFLYGPKPKFVEWLVIEPAQAVAETVPDHITSFLGDIRMQASAAVKYRYPSTRRVAPSLRMTAVGWAG